MITTRSLVKLSALALSALVFTSACEKSKKEESAPEVDYGIKCSKLPELTKGAQKVFVDDLLVGVGVYRLIFAQSLYEMKYHSSGTGRAINSLALSQNANIEDPDIRTKNDCSYMEEISGSEISGSLDAPLEISAIDGKVTGQASFNFTLYGEYVQQQNTNRRDSVQPSYSRHSSPFGSLKKMLSQLNYEGEGEIYKLPNGDYEVRGITARSSYQGELKLERRYVFRHVPSRPVIPQ